MSKKDLKLELSLQSGRVVRFRLPDASDGLEVSSLLEDNISMESSNKLLLQALYARVALMITAFTLPDEDGNHDINKMELREKLSNYKDLKRFWKRFSEKEFEEIKLYTEELTNDEIPENKDEVDKAVDGAIHSKKSSKK
jgi:hypothetical protein